MPLPTIPHCYRVALNYVNSLNSLTATNVIHIGGETTSEEDVFNAVNASVGGNMWSPCTQALQISEVVVTKLDGTPDGVVFNGSALSGDWPDGTGEQQFVPQASALVKLRTAATGRSGRGRVFLPFVAEGAQQNGVVLSANQDACTGAWVDFVTALIEDHAVGLAVASYVNSSFAVVTTLGCERLIATQRKRNKRT